jgi:thiol-disulfide isomerase/thioredoxin
MNPSGSEQQKDAPMRLPLRFLALLSTLMLGPGFSLQTARASFTTPEFMKPITANELKSLIETPAAQGKGVKGKTGQKPIRATVVNFWATWCAPCQEEMPELLQLEKRYAKKGLRLILVSADATASLPEAERFLKKLNANLPSYYLGEPPEDFVKAFDSEWPSTLPATFVYDGNGRKTATIIGKIDFKDFEPMVAATLKSPASLARPKKIGFDQKTRSEQKGSK